MLVCMQMKRIPHNGIPMEMKKHSALSKNRINFYTIGNHFYFIISKNWRVGNGILKMWCVLPVYNRLFHSVTPNKKIGMCLLKIRHSIRGVYRKLYCKYISHLSFNYTFPMVCLVTCTQLVKTKSVHEMHLFLFRSKSEV